MHNKTAKADQALSTHICIQATVARASPKTIDLQIFGKEHLRALVCTVELQLPGQKV